MSAIVPVTGCNNSQPQITAPEAGSTAAATSPANQSPPKRALPLASWVVISSSWTATRVVLMAGRIPLNWAIRKNSSSPRCTIRPRATVNHHPPSITTTKPKPPAAQPLSSRGREVAVRGVGIKRDSATAISRARQGMGAQLRSERGALPQPAWPGCRAVACGARWPAPPARPWLPAG